ncbi:MAG: DUF2335 domain-containing protein [Saprospiraceae bacterium]|nr:DUF2335 domain-containing protein [Candidatus Vicinibacter affinis]
MLENIPESDDQLKLKLLRVITSRTWTGPVPPPEELGKFNDVAPNGADRIIRMAEERNKHDMELEKFVVKMNLN